ncbi:PAS domain-containing protein [Streptomyces benahoarensis]|uniref:PAS domain-containing protein n=1 Tax=Streptomyces benahoarensis TaxID=2595054 RepID=A0A553ZME0_9ACTN|nr:PAS domain-containing protein [Streptomyces benahoarensis]TSB42573.1 PAS domain-containing protein [Streptomyces benahoarensis]
MAASYGSSAEHTPAPAAAPPGPLGPADDTGLLAALLGGMDTALLALAADGTVTHWNHEAEQLLGWPAAEAVGRRGLTGWAVRDEDAGATESALLAALRAPGRQVHDYALLTKDGRRVLVRGQTSVVPGPDGRATGVYCVFTAVHAQIGLERSLALSEALGDDAPWGVVLVDADLRPAVVNTPAARALESGRDALLGRTLGDLLDQGAEEVEAVLQHVLAEGEPPGLSDLWVTLRAPDAVRPRRCWRSGFVRLASPLSEEPVPLGVAWLFQDVTDAKQAEQDGALLRFRTQQLHRAGRAAADCPDPREAAAVHLDYALAGFADHALVDVVAPPPGRDGDDGRAGGDGTASVRLRRALASPAGSPGPCTVPQPSAVPVAYAAGHPALQAYARGGSVRTSVGATGDDGWAAARRWPDGTVHGLCVVLRSRARTLGVATFLRTPARRPFDRADAAYAEEVAARIAAALDLASSSDG